MTNADKFKRIFGLYATELWAKPEKEFLEWLNEDVPDTNVGDTISRRAAIEAMQDLPYGYRGMVRDIIYNLPSAQPEQAVKDCRNCKHGKYNDYHDTYFCYNPEDCSNWDKWETSVQPERHGKRTETHGVCLDSLIKRTDAIDAIEERIKANGYGNVALVSELNRLDGYIRQLPPVQSEIIRCKDCKWFGDIGCAIEIVDIFDRPSENDFCSFAERR